MVGWSLVGMQLVVSKGWIWAMATVLEAKDAVLRHRELENKYSEHFQYKLLIEEARRRAILVRG